MAKLHLNSWAGHTTHQCEILKETPKRYKIKLLEDSLKGKVGTVIYVPKYAITKG